MEKLILLYLKSLYPDAYCYKSKFGNHMCGVDEHASWYDVRERITDSIIRMFSCDYDFASDAIDEWVNNLNVVNKDYSPDSGKPTNFVCR